MNFLDVKFTTIDIVFDTVAFIIFIIGILARFSLEWYKTAKDKSVPYDINWNEQIAASLIALLAYAIIVLMAAHKLSYGEALALGLAPQSVINEFNNMRELTGKKPILTPPAEPSRPPSDH